MLVLAPRRVDLTTAPPTSPTLNRFSGRPGTSTGSAKRLPARRSPRARAAARGGDVERLQVRAAEGAGGDVGDRHLDDAVDLAVGRDADDAAAAVAGVPEVAVAVDRRAVGRAALEAGEERPLVGDGARARRRSPRRRSCWPACRRNRSACCPGSRRSVLEMPMPVFSTVTRRRRRRRGRGGRRPCR